MIMVHENTLQILVVDDNATIGILLKRYFQSAGQTLTVTTQLHHARQLFQQTRYDIVLLDLMLPDGNGLDFLREIQAQDVSTPVIIMSGMQQNITRQNAAREGAAGFLIKPFQLKDVMLLIQQILQRDGLAV